MPNDFNYGEINFLVTPDLEDCKARILRTIQKALQEKDRQIALRDLKIVQLEGTIADLTERLDANNLS